MPLRGWWSTRPTRCHCRICRCVISSPSCPFTPWQRSSASCSPPRHHRVRGLRLPSTCSRLRCPLCCAALPWVPTRGYTRHSRPPCLTCFFASSLVAMPTRLSLLYARGHGTYGERADITTYFLLLAVLHGVPFSWPYLDDVHRMACLVTELDHAANAPHDQAHFMCMHDL